MICTLIGNTSVKVSLYAQKCDSNVSSPGYKKVITSLLKKIENGGVSAKAEAPWNDVAAYHQVQAVASSLMIH